MTKPFVPPYSPSLPDWMKSVAVAVNYKTDIATLTAAPARGDWSSINTAFSGDLGNTYHAFGRSITGTATLGQPTSGYQNNPETAVITSYLYNSSGWNNGTADNTGRTNCHSLWGKVDNYGQGDCSYITASGFVSGARAGATSWLANPAISAVQATFTAGAHGVYLNPVELDLDCSTYDAAAVGYVVNITRNTGDTVNGLGAPTIGFRAQSKGTYSVDSMLSGSGKFKYGLDLTPVTFDTNKAGLAFPAGVRWYGNALSSDGFKATSLGTDWIERSASGFWNIIYNNTSCLQINDIQIGFVKPPKFPTVTTAALPTAAAGNQGMEYYVSDANSTTVRSAVVGGGTNFVKVFSTGSQWLIGH